MTPDPLSFDAGKTVTGRKRPILVDTLGLLLNVIVYPARVQDRDGAVMLLRCAPSPSSSGSTPTAAIRRRSWRLAAAIARIGSWTLEIVKRSDACRFVVLPKRWIVERTFA